MNDNQSFLKKVVTWIGSLIKALFTSEQKPTQSEPLSDPLKSDLDPDEDLIKGAKEIAGDFVANKAGELVAEYGDMLHGMSQDQKEYLYRMAILKSTPTSELTLKETIELGDELNKAAKLNLKITQEISNFWNKFFSVLMDIVQKFAEISVKVLAKILVGYLPI